MFFRRFNGRTKMCSFWISIVPPFTLRQIPDGLSWRHSDVPRNGLAATDQSGAERDSDRTWRHFRQKPKSWKAQKVNALQKKAAFKTNKKHYEFYKYYRTRRRKCVVTQKPTPHWNSIGRFKILWPLRRKPTVFLRSSTERRRLHAVITGTTRLLRRFVMRI